MCLEVDYCSTLVALTQIILLLEMLKTSKITSFGNNLFCEGNRRTYWICFFKMESSNLVSYLSEMCWNHPCTMISCFGKANPWSKMGSQTKKL
jgi:hypothetical protein